MKAVKGVHKQATRAASRRHAAPAPASCHPATLRTHPPGFRRPTTQRGGGPTQNPVSNVMPTFAIRKTPTRIAVGAHKQALPSSMAGNEAGSHRTHLHHDAAILNGNKGPFSSFLPSSMAAGDKAGSHRTHLHQYATIHNAGSHSCQHTVILQTSLTVQAATAADTQ